MITINGLNKQFLNRSILDNIHLTFEPGKVYALIGESGSGKTILLNILAKLEDYNAGTVCYHQKRLEDIPPHVYYRDYLGYLFQNFGLLESETVEANLNLGLIGQNLNKKQKHDAQRAVLEQVNLAYIQLNQKIFELSGGESQRIALAKVILKNPPIILADEPTAALDPINSQEVMELLVNLKNDKRIIVIATHNPAVWEKADVIIRMEELEAS